MGNKGRERENVLPHMPKIVSRTRDLIADDMGLLETRVLRKINVKCSNKALYYQQNNPRKQLLRMKENKFLSGIKSFRPLKFITLNITHTGTKPKRAK